MVAAVGLRVIFDLRMIPLQRFCFCLIFNSNREYCSFSESHAHHIIVYSLNYLRVRHFPLTTERMQWDSSNVRSLVMERAGLPIEMINVSLVLDIASKSLVKNSWFILLVFVLVLIHVLIHVLILQAPGDCELTHTAHRRQEKGNCVRVEEISNKMHDLLSAYSLKNDKKRIWIGVLLFYLSLPNQLITPGGCSCPTISVLFPRDKQAIITWTCSETDTFSCWKGETWQPIIPPCYPDLLWK